MSLLPPARSPRGSLASALLASIALAVPASWATTPLTLPARLTEVSGAASSFAVYQVEVSEGTRWLAFESGGGNGDVELLAKPGPVPGPGDAFAYRSSHAGNLESVMIADPQPGTWNLVVAGVTAFDGLEVRARVVEVPPAIGVGRVTPLAVPMLEFGHLRLDVPAGLDRLEWRTYVPTGEPPFGVEVDLAVGEGVPVGFRGGNRGTAFGTEQEKLLAWDEPSPGDWWVGFSGSEATEAYALEVRVTPGVTLLPGVPLFHGGRDAGGSAAYRFDVPEGIDEVIVHAGALNGAVDLLVARGNQVSQARWDYFAATESAAEVALISGAEPGPHSLLVTTEEGFMDGYVRVEFLDDGVPAWPLGVPRPVVIGATESSGWFVDLPAGASQVVLDAEFPIGATLYAGFGSSPGTDPARLVVFGPGGGTVALAANGPARLFLNVVAPGEPFSGAVTVSTDGARPMDFPASVFIASAATGTQLVHVVQLPEGLEAVQFGIEGGSGDADLYLRRGEPPTLEAYDHRLSGGTSTESRVIPFPGAGPWYALVHAYAAYQGLALFAVQAELPAEPIEPGEGRRVTVEAGTLRRLEFSLPADVNVLRVLVDPGVGEGVNTVRLLHLPPEGDPPAWVVAGSVEAPAANGGMVEVFGPSPGSWRLEVVSPSGVLDLPLFLEAERGIRERFTGREFPVQGMEGNLRRFALLFPGERTAPVTVTLTSSGGAMPRLWVDPGALRAEPGEGSIGGSGEGAVRSVEVPPGPGSFLAITVEGPPGGYFGTLRIDCEGDLLAQFIQPGVLARTFNLFEGEDRFHVLEVPADAGPMHVIAQFGGESIGRVAFGQPPVGEVEQVTFGAGDATASVETPGTDTIAVFAVRPAAERFEGLFAAGFGEPLLLGFPFVLESERGVEDSVRTYRFDVPEGVPVLRVASSGGLGDVDLYLRRGLPPTLATFDEAPYEGGNTELIEIESPEPGPWYLMLHGFYGYDGAVVRAEAVSEPPLPLEAGVATPLPDRPEGGAVELEFTVGPGAARFQAGIIGGTGGEVLSAYRVVGGGSLELASSVEVGVSGQFVTVDGPAVGTWRLRVESSSGWTDVSALLSVDSPVLPLANLEDLAFGGGQSGNVRLFTVEVPEGGAPLQVELFTPMAVATLEVSAGMEQLARLDLADVGVVVLESAPAGTLLVRVTALSDFADAVLRASVGTPFEISPRSIAIGPWEAEIHYDVTAPGPWQLVGTLPDYLDLIPYAPGEGGVPAGFFLTVRPAGRELSRQHVFEVALGGEGSISRILVVSQAGWDATDNDRDGLPDGWELHYFGTLDGTDGLQDFDNDGIRDADELDLSLVPVRADTDGDGYGDGFERERGTNPFRRESFPEAGAPVAHLAVELVFVGRLGALYQVERASPDLENWEPVGEPIVGEGREQSVFVEARDRTEAIHRIVEVELPD